MERQNSCLVTGEASESDEENVVISMVGGKTSKALQGTVILGEAPESDEESVYVDNDEHGEEQDESVNSASEAFMYRAEAAAKSNVNSKNSSNTSRKTHLKYNSLLHKKLYESNVSLHRGMNDLVRKPFMNASQQLNTINQQLLSSQVVIQDAVTAVKRTYNMLVRLDNTLGAVLAMPYLPKINIPVPTKINTC